MEPKKKNKQKIARGISRDEIKRTASDHISVRNVGKQMLN